MAGERDDPSNPGVGDRQVANDRIVVLAPVYEDWGSSLLLLKMLDDELSANEWRGQAVFVDDGSVADIDSDKVASSGLNAISDVTVVRLAQNLGNQRAIAVGLSYIAVEVPCDYLIVMDSDLEDLPEYVPQMIMAAKESGNKMIFAERTQRSEGWSFKILYACYRLAFKVLTGRSIAIGNYSVIPGPLIRRIASISDIWNHFPAGIMRGKVPYETLPTVRGTRVHGKSSMNLVSLVIHGFSGLAVHADVVCVRAVLGILFFTLGIVAAIAAILALNFFDARMLVEWSIQIVTALGSILLQVLIMMIFIVFLVLVGRNHRRIIPLIDFRDFIFETERIYLKSSSVKD